MALYYEPMGNMGRVDEILSAIDNFVVKKDSKLIDIDESVAKLTKIYNDSANADRESILKKVKTQYDKCEKQDNTIAVKIWEPFREAYTSVGAPTHPVITYDPKKKAQDLQLRWKEEELKMKADDREKADRKNGRAQIPNITKDISTAIRLANERDVLVSFSPGGGIIVTYPKSKNVEILRKSVLDLFKKDQKAQEIIERLLPEKITLDNKMTLEKCQQICNKIAVILNQYRNDPDGIKGEHGEYTGDNVPRAALKRLEIELLPNFNKDLTSDDAFMAVKWDPTGKNVVTIRNSTKEPDCIVVTTKVDKMGNDPKHLKYEQASDGNFYLLKDTGLDRKHSFDSLIRDTENFSKAAPASIMAAPASVMREGELKEEGAMRSDKEQLQDIKKHLNDLVAPLNSFLEENPGAIGEDKYPNLRNSVLKLFKDESTKEIIKRLLPKETEEGTNLKFYIDKLKTVSNMLGQYSEPGGRYAEKYTGDNRLRDALKRCEIGFEPNIYYEPKLTYDQLVNELAKHKEYAVVIRDSGSVVGGISVGYRSVEGTKQSIYKQDNDGNFYLYDTDKKVIDKSKKLDDLIRDERGQ